LYLYSTGTVVVNPGQLGKGGSCYADIHIHPIPEDKLRNAHIADAATPLLHGAPARTLVKISKI
jgi:hypothetical protein